MVIFDILIYKISFQYSSLVNIYYLLIYRQKLSYNFLQVFIEEKAKKHQTAKQKIKAEDDFFKIKDSSNLARNGFIGTKTNRVRYLFFFF